MVSDTPVDGKRLTSAFRALADADRRRCLGLVRERSPAPVSTTDLATELAAWSLEKPLVAVTDDEHERMQTRLHHSILPLLAEAELLAYDRETGAVSIASHPASRDPHVGESLTGKRASDESFDDAFGALADPRRRSLLSVVAEQHRPIDVRTLASDLAAPELDGRDRDDPAETVDRVERSLVHTHLPHLADRELIEYDPDENLVAYEGHPELRARWLASGFDRGRSALTDASPTNHRADALPVNRDAAGPGVQTADGRESIVSLGQSLFERADEELFVMITTTGLLEEGCFARLEDAIDRGVDVYLGSREPLVRDAVRERLPEIVLWEPQLDWLNLPPHGGSVGRLVLADREAVMLGTLGEAAIDDDGYEETAIYGAGEDDALVILVRQLLGSRLDHLDAQSEDVLSHLPF